MNRASAFRSLSAFTLRANGHRKYLTQAERAAFLKAAECASREVRTLCGVLAYTGSRISEALALTADRIDLAEGLIVFESLKKRKGGGNSQRLWTWGRTWAWKQVKAARYA